MTMFSNLDLNLLRVFQAIAEERSLTLAGQRLHLSQPAVSYALNRLREVFHDPLFTRSKSGMEPTRKAVELSKPIGQALRAVGEALQYGELFEPSTSTREFRAALSDIAVLLLPALCQNFCESAPQARLHVTHTPAALVDEFLRTGRIDFAVGNFPELKAPVRHAVLFKETYVCLTRERHGLPPGNALELHQFLSMGHVRVRHADVTRHHPELSLAAANVHRRIVLDIPHYSVLPKILESSDLAATVPLRIARLFNAEQMFRIFDLPVPIEPIEISLHWHEEFENDVENIWIRQLVTRSLLELATPSAE